MELIFQTAQGETKSIYLQTQRDGSFQAYIDDQMLRVVPIYEGERGLMMLEIEGVRLSFYAAKRGSEHFVWYAGRGIQLTRTTVRVARQAESHAGDLSAAMPGQVLDVLVAVGEGVRQGDTLVILEAMKMEMRVKAPHDGTVLKVLCTKGDSVERGQLLVEVEKEG